MLLLMRQMNITVKHGMSSSSNMSSNQLKQDKSKTVHQFAGHLEQKFGKLKLKFPCRFEDQQLKERLFHGMPQQL